MLEGDLLIFVELMLITAVALFFSTFSTPLLSAALTFGLYIVGHFNADLRNFEQVVESRPAAWLARGLYHAAARSLGLRHQDGSRARSAVPAGYVARRRRYGLAYIAMLLLVAIADLLAAGFQVTAPTAVTRGTRGARRAGAASVWRRRSRLRVIASIRPRAVRSNAPVRQSGEALKRIALAFDALAADVYWIRAIQHYGGDRLPDRTPLALRAALSAPRPDDHARSVLHDCLQVRRDLPERADPGGPGRPDLASGCSGRGSPPSPTSGSTTTTRRSSITGRCATTGKQPSGFNAPRNSRGRRTGSAARCEHAHGGQRPSCRALLVAADAAIGSGMDASQCRAAYPAARRARHCSINLKRSSSDIPLPPESALSWQGLMRWTRSGRFQPIATGTPFELDPASGRVTVSRTSPLQPMPDSRSGPRHEP